MHNFKHSAATFAFLTLLSAGTAFAQVPQPAPGAPPRPGEPTRPAEQARPAPDLPRPAPQAATASPTMNVEGELVRVDATAKTISIKNEKGDQLDFKYTDATLVTGSDAKVAGLATMSGTPVTIHYTKVEVAGEPAANVASRIEVRKK